MKDIEDITLENLRDEFGEVVAESFSKALSEIFSRIPGTSKSEADNWGQTVVTGIKAIAGFEASAQIVKSLKILHEQGQ